MPDNGDEVADAASAINDFMFSYLGFPSVAPQLKPSVAPLMYPMIRTRQQAYRTAAWILGMAELLPNEEVASTFEQVQRAINNS